VIEHVADPAEALRTLRRMLRKGGRLFVETPNHRSRDWALFRDRYWGGYHFPRHFTVFHPESLAQLCTAAGFEVEEIRYLPSPVFWSQSLHHRLAESGQAGLARFFSVANPVPIGAFYVYDRLRLSAGRSTSKFELTARA
jgi:SAM-dependent methyltransferase